MMNLILLNSDHTLQPCPTTLLYFPKTLIPSASINLLFSGVALMHKNGTFKATFFKTLTFIFLLLTCLKMSSPTPLSPALDADRRKKSSVPEKSRIVTISVNCQDHKTLSFQIKGDAPLKKLVDKYFERASVARTLVELVYNGERLQVQRTPDQLGMKDVVEIDAMIHANGGGNQL